MMFSIIMSSQTLLAKSSWVKYALAVLGGSLFLSLSAKVNIPFWPVPITMQSFSVIFLSALYGRNLAVATVAAYLLEGLAGFPVFYGLKAGPAYFLSPTAGYLLGFLGAAFTVGSLADRGWGKTFLSSLGLFVIGALAIDIPGLIWLKTFVPLHRLVEIWLSYQVAFILKTSLGTILLDLIETRRKNAQK